MVQSIVTVKPASENIKYNELYIVNYSVTVQPWQQCCSKHTREDRPLCPSMRRMLFHWGAAHLLNVRVNSSRAQGYVPYSAIILGEKRYRHRDNTLAVAFHQFTRE